LDELKEFTDDLHLITVGNADLTFYCLFVGHSLTSVDKCQEHASLVGLLQIGPPVINP
jgi:hypothetical protein